MGSALLDTRMDGGPVAVAGDISPAPNAGVLPESLRHQVAERLAAHRSRRGMATPTANSAGRAPRAIATRAARIAATVAERYAQSQSYRAFLAAEAERAVQQAHAAAEVARLNAQAVATAQQKLLEDFDNARDAAVSATPAAVEEHSVGESQSAGETSFWPEAERELPAPPHASNHRSTAAAAARHEAASTYAVAEPAPAPVALTVRLYGDERSAAHVPSARRSEPTVTHPHQHADGYDPEALALDEEIAFRQAPVFEEEAGPPMPLPANLIEFPRQLIAARKARPRLAEGPLREDGELAPLGGQLRIFEVESAQISNEPPAAVAAEPQWTSIWLEAPRAGALAPAAGDVADYGVPDTIPFNRALPQVARLRRRTLAAALDAGIVLTGLSAFAAGFYAMTRNVIPWQSFASIHTVLGELSGKVPAGPGLQPALLLGTMAAAAVFLYVLYQALFFSFSDATPGMRCARIALCTFDDNNPTRRAMRRRIAAGLASACPLGLGLVWALLDEDRLAWHDRLSRMYQRSY